MENWLEAWREKHGIELISTKWEMKDGIVTGKFSTKNCYGIEKANRVNEAYDLSDYDHGDSRGDKELLALADESFYKPFRDV